MKTLNKKQKRRLSYLGLFSVTAGLTSVGLLGIAVLIDMVALLYMGIDKSLFTEHRVRKVK